MNSTRRKGKTDHGKTSHSFSLSEETAFEFGVLYSTIKDELVAFAAKTGGAHLFTVFASRVARLLEAEALREQYRSAEYLPQMWQDSNPTGAGRSPRNSQGMAANLSDDAPRRRTLSADARARIAAAQRARWARTKEKREMARERGRRHYAKTHPNKASGGIKGFWAKMTAAERQAEIMRRREVAAKKKPDRRRSPETRAKISAIRKKYWADKRAAEKRAAS